MAFVFLSHAQRDKLRPDNRLACLVRFLISCEIPLWIDRPEELGLDTSALNSRFISIDGQWPTELRSALRNCSAGLGVWSRHSAARLADDPAGVLFQELNHLSVSGKLFLINLDSGSFRALASLGGLASNQQCIDLAVSTKPVFALRIRGLCEALCGRPYVALPRADLLEALIAAAESAHIQQFPREVAELYQAFEEEDPGAAAPTFSQHLATALDRHWQACRVRNVPMRNFHRLLATMQTPSLFVKQTFNAHEAGLGDRLQDWLKRQVEKQYEDIPFRTEEVVADLTYQHALSLAESESASEIDERHYFLALTAAKDSGTIARIIEGLGVEAWAAIERIASSTRPRVSELQTTTGLDSF